MLRTATRPAHEALHQAAPFARIFFDTCTLEDYRGTLQVLWRFHASMLAPCDEGAALLGVPHFAVLHRRRLERLQRDMACLDVAYAEMAKAGIPSDAGCVGALYTVMGSVLGGAVLHRRLARLLPHSDGCRFFAAMPEELAAWAAFRAALEQYGSDRRRWPALRAGATAAFAHFAACLEPVS